MVFEGYKVSSKYGYRNDPIDGGMKFHAGIDLIKKYKSPVYSFTSGKVIHAGLGETGTGLGNYGNCVLVNCGGRGLLYAHLDEVTVVNGQNVKKGFEVGTLGQTGRATGPNLHFEVRKDIEPSFGWTSDASKSTINPSEFIRSYENPTSDNHAVVPYPNKLFIAEKPFPQGKDVERIQRALNNAVGKKIVNVDGYYGPKTATAVGDYQRRHGLKQDEIVGENTWNTLF